MMVALQPPNIVSVPLGDAIATPKRVAIDSDTIATARDLERTYLEMWCDVPAGKGFTAPGRQILHCTFGSVLTHSEFGPAVRGVLESHLDTYTEVLDEHFARHLEALKAGM